MPIMNHPGGFKFDFGSTVTILTTAASGAEHGKNADSLGVFTGVVLDEAKLKLKRAPKHVSIHMDGIDESADGDYEPEKDKGHDWCKDDKDKDYDWGKDDKDKDYDWGKDDKDKDYDWCKDDKDKDYDWGKDDKDKDHDDWCKDDKKKDHHGKKHGHAVEVKKEDEFLVLSLTCPSFPFTAGQIVWINVEHIVALAVVCRN
jgi:hypothetical protein